MTYSSSDLRKIFEKVRDDPFKIPTGWGEVINTCYGKNLYLCKKLEEMGYRTRLMVAATSWTSIFDYLSQRDPSIALMLDDLRQLHHMDDTFHVYAKVFVDGKLVVVDTTFDKPLTPTFPLIEWDGSRSSGLAVPVTKKFDAQESRKMLSDKGAMNAFENELLTNTDFYKGINNVAQHVRFRNE